MEGRYIPQKMIRFNHQSHINHVSPKLSPSAPACELTEAACLQWSRAFYDATDLIKGGSPTTLDQHIILR